MKWLGFLNHRGIWLLVAVCMVTLAGWYHDEGRYAADTNSSVHHQMTDILNEEVPVDVSQIQFKGTGSHQECYLSDRKNHADAALPNLPHAVHVVGYLARKGDGWESRGPFSNQWVWSLGRDSKRVDAAAISEPDFRALVRQCVATVRDEQHRAHGWVLTEAQNRASWSARPSQN